MRCDILSMLTLHPSMTHEMTMRSGISVGALRNPELGTAFASISTCKSEQLENHPHLFTA